LRWNGLNFRPKAPTIPIASSIMYHNDNPTRPRGLMMPIPMTAIPRR
jgi:hypothetical protein